MIVWNRLEMIRILWNMSLLLTSVRCLSMAWKLSARPWNGTLQSLQGPKEQVEDQMLADLLF